MGSPLSLQTPAKIALITGASSGLGAEFAHQLAARGYNLILTARREEQLQNLARLVQSRFNNQLFINPADLSKLSGIDQLISAINNLDSIDILVNNAGFGTVGRFHRVDED